MTSFDGGISCAMTTCEEMPADALEPVTDDSLVAVISVELGEPVTFSCSLSTTEITGRQVNWYKQRAGDTLKLVRNEDTWIYSAVMFTMMKTNRQGTASAERERIYAAVKASGLDQ
ncbi:hypothetical protein INR49_028163 [Caranx melampygus]|nr:hypothetical protein INR49_028163 [Caranx melampygus]